jgi:hypothetical protein
MKKEPMGREEAAILEIGVTRAGGRVRWVLISGFLCSILLIPILQAWKDLRGAEAGKPPALSAFLTAFPRAATAGKERMPGGLCSAISKANHSLKEDFRAFEKSLEKDSFLRHRFLPAFQWFVSKYLSLGNEKVFWGRDGWLYYRPDVEYLTTGPFPLPGEETAGRGKGRKNDPVTALKTFRDDLSKRGIKLLVLPVPVKPMIEPEHLWIGSRAVTRLQNPSYPSFVKILGSEGIEVLDPTSLILERKHSTGKAQYLQRDTHWTPEAMEAVADSVAEKLRELSHSDFPSQSNPGVESLAVRQSGDLTGMLDLPRSAPLFADQEVSIRPNRNAKGSPWKPDPSSPVLLLGDSFARIFSAEDLGWGRDAGLAERLSEKLGGNIDVLAINAGGSSSTRQSLARSPDRLEGKKFLLYEFSMRDLAAGDWTVIPIPETGPSVLKPRHQKESSTVTGVISEVSEIPPPGSTPYKDFVRSLRLKVEQGCAARDILVFVQALRRGEPTGAGSLKSGQRVSLHLVPWDDVEQKFGSLNRSELQGAAADLPDVYWADDY